MNRNLIRLFQTLQNHLMMITSSLMYLHIIIHTPHNDYANCAALDVERPFNILVNFERTCVLLIVTKANRKLDFRDNNFMKNSL